MRERRRDYELMFIVSPLNATEEGVTAVIERIKNSIEAEGGAVTGINHSAPWGRRKLAYPIREYVVGEPSRRNFTEGYYVLMHFSLSSARVAEVERTIKLTDTIIRYLITLVEKKRAGSRVAAADEVGEIEELVEDNEE